MIRRSASVRRAISRLTVLALVDEWTLKPGTNKFVPETSNRHVVEALAGLVRRPVVAAFTTLEQLLSTLLATSTDVVFNLTQQALNDRALDTHICAALELAGVPYTGSGPRGLMLGRDKALSKVLAAEAGFRVPRHFVVDSARIDVPADFPFPAIVKPRFGEASEHLSQRSVVNTRRALEARARAIRRSGAGDVICEEYIGGREIAVPMYGDHIVRPREILFGRTGRGAPRIACNFVKRRPEYRRRWRIGSRFANITPSEADSLRRICTKAAALLDMRDYGRFDLKLTPEGEWVFLEANPHPGLAKPGSSWCGHWEGVDYEEMMAEIIHRAWRRRP